MTMTEQFPWPPDHVIHAFLLKSHEKQSNGKSWKRGFCALSKLVYFKTQLLELVESSMEVPKYRTQDLEKFTFNTHSIVLPHPAYSQLAKTNPLTSLIPLAKVYLS